MAGPMDRIRGAWNAFRRSPGTDNPTYTLDFGQASYGIRPDRVRLNGTSRETAFTASVFTQIGIDVASIPVIHAKLDAEDRFIEPIDSSMNECFRLRANIDQSGRAFFQDAAMSLCEEGTIAIVPVETSDNPNETGAFDIYSLRVGSILEWYPRHVKLRLYDDRDGKFKEVTVAKSIVAIVENPLYRVMNEPNSTLKRLIRKLNLLDVIDEQSGSGKLDIIIQLPYSTHSEVRKERAEKRRKDIEMQLLGSKYGIAYADANEKITQLNRPVENNLMEQVNNLTTRFYGELGFTEELFNGSADEKTTLNYYNRTVEPILSAIVDSMRATFLTKTARTQHQSIIYVRDPFKLVPVEQLAEIADKFTRNAILSSNEFRQIIGYKPVKDPDADKLRNKNLNQTSEPTEAPAPSEDSGTTEEESE